VNEHENTDETIAPCSGSLQVCFSFQKVISQRWYAR